jgi:error-prone DNA polymerase
MNGYAELVCTTNFTFLTGASHPEELVDQARAHGYAALAITDECSLAGVVKAYAEHKDNPGDLKLIIGARFLLQHDDDSDTHPHTHAHTHATTEPLPLVLLAPDRAAYAELSTLITLGRRRCGKGDYHLTLNDVRTHIHRCLGLLLPDDISPGFEQGARELTAPFAGRLWLGLSLTQQDDDYSRFCRYRNCAQRLSIPLTACGDVLMHAPERKLLLDVVTAIRLGTSVQALGRRAQKNTGRCLRPFDTLRRVYPPELLDESLRIAERCTFSLGELRYEYPAEIIPAGRDASDYLAELTWAGARRRWPQGIEERVLHQIRKELDLVRELRYEHFFLTVYDIVRVCPLKGHPLPGPRLGRQLRRVLLPWA